MKIAIIGYSGAGKSTPAKTLGEKYSCDVLHLDGRSEKAKKCHADVMKKHHDKTVVIKKQCRLDEFVSSL